MIIRKLFTFEGSHIVRNCTTEKCKYSRHGHSYKVELLLQATTLDAAGMVVDFGLLSGPIKEFIESFDHAETVWIRDDLAVKQAKEFSHRFITVPFNPTAENFALMFLAVITEIINTTKFSNDENFNINSVIVHETATGYAQAFISDLRIIDYKLSEIEFSPEIKASWKVQNLYELIIKDKCILEKMFLNKKPHHQIERLKDEC